MIVIDDMESAENLLKDIDVFFRDFDTTNKKLVTELSNKEAERDDLLHEIEFGKDNKLGIGERAKVYSRLEKVLQERRIIKDKIDLLKTMKPFSDDYIRKRNMWRNSQNSKKHGYFKEESGK